MNLLTNEQIAYLKGLESKKKRREFLLDCLVENVIGESEKIDSSKITDSLGYLLPKKYKEFLEFTNSDTTAPRTFEGLESFAEKNKWDKNPKLEDIIKSKLIIRGFKNEDLLNNRGLIGATIDETVLEVVKNYQSANENSEEKFTKLDMCISFHKGRMIPKRIVKDGDFGTDKSFDDWFQKFKKEKENDKSAN